LVYSLAEQAQKAETRKTLHEMAAEEREHKAKLEPELMKLGQVVPDLEPTPTPTAEQDDMTTKATEQIDPQDFQTVIMLAMERENLSLHTYIGLATEATNSQWRETLIAIAKEEALHYAKLKIEYDMFVNYNRSSDE
jgi:rubrerythrin